MVSSPCSTGTVLPCDEKKYAELGERFSIDCHLSDIVAPKRSCPQIGECFDCRKCVIKNTDTITCSVSGSRPSVNFTFDAINMTHVTNTTTKIQYDNSSDTWTTSSTINIHSRSCNMSLKLGCKVEGNYPFELSDSYANVQLDTCSGIQRKEPRENPSSDPASHTAIPIIITIILLLVLVIVFLVAAGFIIKKRRELGNTDGIPQYETPLIEIEDKKGLLISHLENIYSGMRYITPLPWGKPIDIEQLYSPTTFVVTMQDGKEYTEASNVFLESSDFDSIKRALFKAELGNGKTTLQKYLAWQWSEKTDMQKQQKLLFFLEVKDINMGLAEALCRDLHTDLDINRNEILRLLKTIECQIVMYGLEAISDPSKDTRDHKMSDPKDIQIKRILAERIDKVYPNLQLLVTSSELDKAVPCFKQPYTEIKMKNFNKKQLDIYIQKVCEIYMSSNPHSSSESKHSYQDKVTTVKKHLNDNDLIENFRDCPLYMCTFIHILSLEGTSSAKIECNINKLSSLLGAVVSCLVLRHTQKQKVKEDRKEIENIERQLGKVSLEKREKITSCWDKKKLEKCIGKKNLDTAITIGFLKLTSGNITTVRFSTLSNVTFFHPWVQDFLIAQYTDLKQLKKLKQMFQNISDREKVARVLKFVCGTSEDTELISEIIEFSVNEKLWNVFIDCLHEVRDDLNVKELTKGNIKTALSTQDVNVDMLEGRYHQNAVLEFCNLCQANKITLTTMCFNGLVPDSFVKELTLPTMKQLILQKTTFDIDDTVTTLIEKATKDNSVETLRFLECTLPERITLSDNLRETCLNSKCKEATKLPERETVLTRENTNSEGKRCNRL
ncbi:hypothetical protein BSL78_15789 [Apostichopus japonicus]|uniref:NACHT domain-containing protein n=1 Tax=Stichopus japonicus TaxID=307972 RepID=A0A2G8KH91_STIJA|nr:hypothetical protein BSL78_15789 [Apostichopus japonicus]